SYRFIRSDDEDDEQASWEQRVAKKYYDTLFKEYALCDLKHYKKGKIALRWRTQREVVHGKGQFVCASTRCDETKDLKSWEVNFGYIEHGEKKNELVKVRLCPDCSYRLNYRTQKRQVKKKETKQKRARSGSSDEEDVDNKRQRRRKHRKHEDDKSSSDQGDDQSGDEQQQKGKEEKDEASSIWSKPMESKQEKTKEEEFEDYFADLLQ
ncbi:folate-sensitive fragile site protein Fra10Ac1-domain-containing protein, partial [Zychaea mexicana]|uniref:folate-sensitive fragile site protein Fra10Ac1-domain-containing protein n=1 Tax=Zychaea mexicana TaxID=64656 RepID=UPI0022FEDAE9